jgi:hypothetical protein
MLTSILDILRAEFLVNLGESAWRHAAKAALALGLVAGFACGGAAFALWLHGLGLSWAASLALLGLAFILLGGIAYLCLRPPPRPRLSGGDTRTGLEDVRDTALLVAESALISFLDGLTRQKG